MKGKADFRRLMCQDLMRVYREVCHTGEFSNNTECFEEVVRHPAPRFYIDPRFAHTVISPMLRGDRSKLEIMKPLTRQMYEDLFNVVVRLSQNRQYYGKKLNFILQFAVLEPAPRFYIGSTRMRQIWLDEKRKTGNSRAFKKQERPYLRKHNRYDKEKSEMASHASAGVVVGVHAHCGL